MATRALFLLLAGVVGLAAGPAHAGRFAVLPVDAQRDGGALALRAAVALRAVLKQQGVDVLDVKTTRDQLERYTQRGGADLASYKRRFEQSDQALAALDQDRSLQILETLIQDLAQDQSFTAEKQTLLEMARLKLASRLIGLAGARETGNAETSNGLRARALLNDALRANPTLTPSKAEYPPRFHAALDGARTELNALGTGGLSVDSRPPGATVYVEGRNVGQTPLVLGNDVLARGNYRLWVEVNGARSVPQVVKVDGHTPKIDIDLAFEGALWADGAGLRPVVGGIIDEQVGQKVGRFLGVDTVILVGQVQYSDAVEPSLFGAALSVVEGVTGRRGAVTIKDDVGVEAAVADLANFLSGGDRGKVEDKPLPPTVLPEKGMGIGPGAVASSSPGLSVTTRAGGASDLPWVPILVAGGGVAAVAAIAAGIVALVLVSPRDGAAVVTVKDL